MLIIKRARTDGSFFSVIISKLLWLLKIAERIRFRIENATLLDRQKYRIAPMIAVLILSENRNSFFSLDLFWFIINLIFYNIN
jgi:hypothetical protein